MQMAFQQQESEGNRLEYGYGSGYINGYLGETDICFEKGENAPCIKNIKLL